MIADDDTSKLWAPITPTIFVSIFPKCLIFDSPEQFTGIIRADVALEWHQQAPPRSSLLRHEKDGARGVGPLLRP